MTAPAPALESDSESQSQSQSQRQLQSQLERQAKLNKALQFTTSEHSYTSRRGYSGSGSGSSSRRYAHRYCTESPAAHAPRNSVSIETRPNSDRPSSVTMASSASTRGSECNQFHAKLQQELGGNKLLNVREECGVDGHWSETQQRQHKEAEREVVRAFRAVQSCHSRTLQTVSWCYQHVFLFEGGRLLTMILMMLLLLLLLMMMAMMLISISNDKSSASAPICIPRH